jgi:hypothetical protein
VQIGDRSVVLMNVYFECYENSSEYKNRISQHVGYIECMVDEFGPSSDLIILGVTNFSCSVYNSGFSILKSLLDEYNLIVCDDLSNNKSTYVNEALGHSSCIDHFFVNVRLRSAIISVNVIDSVINHSDHKLLTCCLLLDTTINSTLNDSRIHSNKTRYATRWDKAELSKYYDMLYALLEHLNSTDCCVQCTVGCKCKDHLNAIDYIYDNVVSALQQAELLCVPHVPINSLKPFWN